MQTRIEFTVKSCIRHKIGLEYRSAATSCQRQLTKLYQMVSHTSKKVYILGVTTAGRAFRPSDWAERLAGVMSQFRPGGARPGSHLAYSPWCVPTSVNGMRCVIVNEALRAYNVMAWDFCMNFAKDNELQLSHGAPPEVSPVRQPATALA